MKNKTKRVQKRIMSFALAVLMQFSVFDTASFGAEIIDENEDTIEFNELPEITTEYKLGLESLKEKLPDQITASENGEQVSYQVVDWEPVSDYDDLLGEYQFVPVLAEEESLPENLELPTITVEVENEGDGGTMTRSVAVDLGYDVPSLNAEIPAATSDYYNGFEEGYLPKVRSQGSEGACWAFAAIGAVETDLIKDGNASNASLDLAELQLAYYESHSFDDPKDCNDSDTITVKSGVNYVNNGGTAAIAYRLFANGVGPIDEKYAPYELGTSYQPDALDAQGRNVARIENVYNIPLGDHEDVKAAILAHGGVSASFYANERTSASTRVAYSATYNSFYGKYSATNHEIMLVGWDDNFPKEHFAEGCQPDADGAWLVRNSWGLNDYGKNGYFWLSYYDAGLLAHTSTSTTAYATAYDVVMEKYDNTYSYTNQPASTKSLKCSKKIVATTEYEVDAGEKIQALGLELGSTQNTVKATVSDGTTSNSATITTSYAGYYTIKLDSPMEITEKKTVTVKIEVEAPANGMATLLLETPNKDISYNYITYHGSHSSKTTLVGDDKDFGDNYDIRMMLYTNNVSTEPPQEPENPKEPEESEPTKTYKINYKTDDQTLFTNKNVSYTIGDADACKLSTPYKKGYSFLGWYTDESLTSQITDEELLAGKYQKDLTVYPKWEAIKLSIKYYTCAEKSNEFKTTEDELCQITIEDMPYTLPVDKASAGRTFSFWSKDEKGQEKLETITDEVFDFKLYYSEQGPVYVNNTQSLSLYQQLVPLVIVNVLFSGGDTAANPIKAIQGEKIGQLPEVSKVGYTFAGWQNSLEETITEDYVVKEDTDFALTAKLLPIKYTICFDKNAAKAKGQMLSLEANYGQSYIIPKCAYSYKNHKFVGWSISKDSAEKAYGKGDVVTNLTVQDGDTVTLYAIWKNAPASDELSEPESFAPTIDVGVISTLSTTEEKPQAVRSPFNTKLPAISTSTKKKTEGSAFTATTSTNLPAIFVCKNIRELLVRPTEKEFVHFADSYIISQTDIDKLNRYTWIK